MDRILLVEDDPGVADALSMFFEALGYTVQIANSVAEAHAALGVTVPDVVISDELLADGRGSDFLRVLAARHPCTTRIALTASEARDVGALPPGTLVRRKPWDIRDAEDTLRAVCHRPVP